MRPGRTSALAGTAVAALALATAVACSKKRDKELDVPATGKPAEGTGGAEAPARGGHVVIPSTEPTYLNPVLETRFNRANQLIFEGLVALDAALQPAPRLAESWQVSDDGRTITFKLRPDVKWHDGRPFTSRDVAFTVDKLQTTELQILWKGYFANLEALETPDDHTVVVRYARPYAPALAIWTLGILPAHAFDGETDILAARANEEPVGTGPYRLARWEKGARLLLTANEEWWYGRAHIDTIELRLGVRDSLAALRAGEIDFADVVDIEEWSNEALLPEFRERFEVGTVVTPLFRAIAWNLNKSPLDDRRVRLALTHALDRGRVIDDILLGQAQALSAPFFPNMRVLDASIAPHPFDLDRAVRLLDEAGHPSREGRRFGLVLVANDSQRTPPNEEMLAIFRRDLAAIGIELRVEFMSALEFQHRVGRREFDAAFFGWLPDIADPDPTPLLHSSQVGVGYNLAGYVDEEADELLEAAVSRPRLDERRALYHRLHAKLHQDLPYTVLYAPYRHHAWNRRLRGVHPEDIGAQPRFPGLARWWIVEN
jgi:peptide/nickel transport system substrate-binding protein